MDGEAPLMPYEDEESPMSPPPVLLPPDPYPPYKLLPPVKDEDDPYELVPYPEVYTLDPYPVSPPPIFTLLILRLALRNVKKTAHEARKNMGFL